MPVGVFACPWWCRHGVRSQGWCGRSCGDLAQGRRHRRISAARPGDGHTCVRQLPVGLGEAGGRRRGPKRAAKVGAGGCRAEGALRAAQSGPARPGRGGPAEGPGGSGRALGAPPARPAPPAAARGPLGASPEPQQARDRRWAVRRGRFLRRRRGEPGMERVRFPSHRTGPGSRRGSLKAFPALVPFPIPAHLRIRKILFVPSVLVCLVPRRAANLNFQLLSRRQPA